MSPWGKFYLENVEYNADWWDNFDSWRMWHSGILDHMNKTYKGRNWTKVSRHLDILESELCKTQSKKYLI